jgi:hypothetical protein
VLAELRIRVLVQVRAIELCEGPSILGEVGRDPVDDDADTGLMQAVDEESEVVGIAETRRRREVGRDLVAP